MTIAERVRELRKKEGLTQEQLAQALFISDAAISHIESGFRLPSKSVAMKLADRYGKSTDYFLLESVDNDINSSTASNPPPQNSIKKIPLTSDEEEKLIKIVMQSVDEFLDENGLEMSIDGKAKIFAHLLKIACKEPIVIKGILSGMLLANSNYFKRGK